MKKKQIIINTENLHDMYKLYKKYKKIIYKNTEFIYNGENQEINDIIEALNKKTRLQRIVYIYMINHVNRLTRILKGKTYVDLNVINV